MHSSEHDGIACSDDGLDDEYVVKLPSGDARVISWIGTSPRRTVQ